MSDELRARLTRLADEMTEIADLMHQQGGRIDQSGDIHKAFILHRNADVISGAARIAREWAREVAE